MTVIRRLARRVREPGERNANIYRRADGKFEVGYRDSDGRQRWKTVEGGISAARAERDRILGARASGEVVRPNAKLRFGEARDAWLEREVVHLRPKTQESYRDAARRLPWERRRMDSIGVADVAQVVSDLRARGLSEWTIAGTLKAASAVFRFARRQMRWSGTNPVDDLSPAQRPKLSQARRRRLHADRELEATIAAAVPWAAVALTFIASTALRESEALGLLWRELHLDDDVPYVEIVAQLSRKGERVDVKTDASSSVVALTPDLVTLLKTHKLRSRHSGPDDFIFATATGTAVSQRNLLRELDRAQRAAVDEHGEPIFPTAFDENGNRVPRAEAGLPTIHGMRHTLASKLVDRGVSVEDVSKILRHKTSVVTAAVYVHEIRSAEQMRRRAELLASMGQAGVIAAAHQSSRRTTMTLKHLEVVDLGDAQGISQ